MFDGPDISPEKADTSGGTEVSQGSTNTQNEPTPDESSIEVSATNVNERGLSLAPPPSGAPFGLPMAEARTRPRVMPQELLDIMETPESDEEKLLPPLEEVNVEHEINLEAARAFLRLLAEEDETLCFQLFSDSGKVNLAPLTLNDGPDLRSVESTLRRANAKGYGIFVTVNKTDGQGRKSGNIIAVRAVFADLDGVPLPETHPLKPHAIIESSPGKYHIYYKTGDVSLPDFGAIQRRLITHYKSDRKVIDLPRVMRLPGFFHRKDEPPKLVRILDLAEELPPYTKQQICAAFPGIDTPETAHADQKVLKAATRMANYYRGALASEVSKISMAAEGERNSTLFNAACNLGSIVASGLGEEDEVVAAMKAAALAVGLQETETDRTIQSGLARGMSNPREIDLDGGWTRPRPLEQPLNQGPKFVPHLMFPDRLGWFADYVDRVADNKQVDPSMPALACLVAVSLAISRVVELQVHPGWIEKPQIWALGLAEPSERKSSVLGEITAPIHAWNGRLLDLLKPAVARWNARRNVMLKRLDKLQAALASNNREDDSHASIQAQIDSLTDMIELTPEMNVPQYLTIDSTPEAMAELLVKNGEKLGVIVAEGDIVDIVGGRYTDQANLGLMLSSYTGEPYVINRRNRPPVHLDCPAMAIGLIIQPQAAHFILKNRESTGRGFLSRFIMALHRSLVGGRKLTPPPIPDPLKRMWENAICGLFNLPFPGRITLSSQGELGVCKDAVRKVELSEGAKVVFDNLRHMVERELNPWDGVLADDAGWGGKLCGNIARIALAMEMLDDPISLSVKRETMEAACSWSEYLIENFRSIYAEAAVDPVMRMASRVIYWIKRHGFLEVNSSVIRSQMRGKGFEKAQAFDPVYRVLIEHGYIQEKPNSANTRSKTFLVNPLWLAASDNKAA